jgi:hypothetical protein
METSGFVTVFNFSEFELGSDAPYVSAYKATRETIVSELKCDVMEGTGEVVPVTALDDKGRYRRFATGWGELPSS